MQKDKFRIARVRAEKQNLHVTAGFVLTDRQELLDGGISTGPLGTVLNGALNSYAPMVNTLVGKGAFVRSRNVKWSRQTTIPLLPEANEENGLVFTVRAGGK